MALFDPSIINQAVRRLENHAAYQKWRSENPPQESDLLVINNSFVFRGAVATAKSPHYLCAQFHRSKRLKYPVSVASPEHSQNVDFRRVSKHETPPPLTRLADSVAEQQKKLGHVVFALISHVSDDRPVEIAFNQPPFSTMSWDPSLPSDVEVKTNSVALKAVEDEVALWAAFEAECARQSIPTNDRMKQEFAKVLDDLQGRASASLRLPDKSRRTRSGVTDTILKALRGQRQDYKTALTKYKAARTDATRRVHFNEVLRVAYAFASEATTLLQLIVSVCDLKPLILWSTIDGHYKLSEALRELPWTRSKHKPTLKNYIDSVGDSRNKAFHNVFPFEKALHFELPAGALDGAELRMFSEFGSKSHSNLLDFPDKELVDVMMQFTRARHRPTPISFWEKNESVMDALIDLFSNTNNVLKDLYHS